jgi:hypothetical protein
MKKCRSTMSDACAVRRDVVNPHQTEEPTCIVEKTRRQVDACALMAARRVLAFRPPTLGNPTGRPPFCRRWKETCW